MEISVNSFLTRIKKLSIADAAHTMATHDEIDCSEDELRKRTFSNRIHEQAYIKFTYDDDMPGGGKVVGDILDAIKEKLRNEEPNTYWTYGKFSAWFDIETDNGHAHVDYFQRGITTNYPMTIHDKLHSIKIKIDYFG